MSEPRTRTKYTYDSFGKLTASSGSLVNSFQYTARESDTETGLYYYRARYYDPTAGRFVSEDPIGFYGGDTNLYRYVWNSPTRFADPIGEMGFGVSGGGSLEGGVVLVGAGATGSLGGGVFYHLQEDAGFEAEGEAAGVDYVETALEGFGVEEFYGG